MKEDIDILGIILDVVSEHFGIKKENMFNKTRIKEIIRARQIFHYLARQKASNVSLSIIGRFYSDKSGKVWDHATVLHSIGRVSDELDVYKSVRDEVSFISEKVDFRIKNPWHKISHIILSNLTVMKTYKHDINNQDPIK